MSSRLNYFINKPCTIITASINRNFTEKQFLDYFTGFVESIDSEGVLLRQLSGNQKTYIFLDHIISIAEEEFVPDPEPAAPVKTEETSDKVVQKQTKTNKYINADALSSLSQQMKQIKNI